MRVFRMSVDTPGLRRKIHKTGALPAAEVLGNQFLVKRGKKINKARQGTALRLLKRFVSDHALTVCCHEANSTDIGGLFFFMFVFYLYVAAAKFEFQLLRWCTG